MSGALGLLVVAWHPPRRWVLIEPLSFVSSSGVRVQVPAGFVTDLASVPRLPGLYITLGGMAHGPAALHDWLYASGQVSRRAADRMFLEACLVERVPRWKARLLYIGVRLFGGSRYGRSS